MPPAMVTFSVGLGGTDSWPGFGGRRWTGSRPHGRRSRWRSPGRWPRQPPRLACDDREVGQFHRLAGGHGQIVGPGDVVADDAARGGLQARRAVDVMDDGRRALPSASSVPIHWSLGLTTPVPSEVAKTVVAASEPRLPTMVTVVLIGEPVGLVNVSTVRAKSWLPVLGTVTLRLDGQAGDRAGCR